MWLVLALGCVPDTEKPDDQDGDGYSELDGDCADDDAGRFPGAPEVCDGADQDCDGVVDEDPADPVTRYVDADGDGVGSDVAVTGCDPDGVELTGDCDDADAARHPGATEVCDSQRDEDCDGTALGCVPEGDTAIEAGLELTGEGIEGFGTVVAAIGDQTGDGLADLYVSAPLRLPEGSPIDNRFGWVFSGASDGRLTHEQADGAVLGFADRALRPGTAVAADDLDHDGQMDLLLGAPGNYANLYDYGAVYLIPGPITGEIRAPAYPTSTVYQVDGSGAVYCRGQAFDDFGASLAVVPDHDGDGFDELAVGAPAADTPRDSESGSWNNAGTAHLFPGAADLESRSPDPISRVFGVADDGEVGKALLGLPDVDGDGLGEWVVGAPGKADQRGAIAIHRTVTGDVDFDAAALRVDGSVYGGRFGASLAYLAQSGQLLVGAPSRDGKVWAIPLGDLDRGTFVIEDVGAVWMAGAGDEALGGALGVGDVDGDNLDDVVAGADGSGTVRVRTASELSWGLTGGAYSVGTGVVVVDTDGDPFTDLAIADPGASRAVVWRGRGI